MLMIRNWNYRKFQRNILSGPKIESGVGAGRRNGPIEIHNTTLAALCAILEYIYTDEAGSTLTVSLSPQPHLCHKVPLGMLNVKLNRGLM
jgi:hypothetical protein